MNVPTTVITAKPATNPISHKGIREVFIKIYLVFIEIYISLIEKIT
jgi:hypothetical protein